MAKAKRKKTKRKKPKNSPLPNFAPVCFEAIPAKWNECELKEINAIKKKYGFKNFDLYEHLAQLSIQGPSIIQGLRQIPSIKNQHQYVDAISQAAKKLTAATQELENLLNCTGSTISSIIAKNTNGTYKTFQHIRDQLLPSLSGNPNLDHLIQGCKRAKQKLPPSKRGRYRNPLKLAIIQYLVAIYVKGTGKEPTCGYDRINGTHVGDCYDYLADLNSVILTSLNLQFEEESTLGQYLHEELKYRKERLKEGYSILACHLLSDPIPNTTQINYILAQLDKAFFILQSHPQVT